MAMDDKTMSSNDSLARLADVIESRKPANGGDPDKSYVSRLLHKGPDAFLKKIGEEATEVVMAAKVVAPGPERSRRFSKGAAPGSPPWGAWATMASRLPMY